MSVLELDWRQIVDPVIRKRVLESEIDQALRLRKLARKDRQRAAKQGQASARAHCCCGKHVGSFDQPSLPLNF